MAHIPIDDIQQLWDETPQRSWKALHKTLEAHVDKAEGISNVLVLDMLKTVGRLDKEGKPYPQHLVELYSELNAQVSQQS